jgi:hypothetical protein
MSLLVEHQCVASPIADEQDYEDQLQLWELQQEQLLELQRAEAELQQMMQEEEKTGSDMIDPLQPHAPEQDRDEQDEDDELLELQREQQWGQQQADEELDFLLPWAKADWVSQRYRALRAALAGLGFTHLSHFCDSDCDRQHDCCCRCGGCGCCGDSPDCCYDHFCCCHCHGDESILKFAQNDPQTTTLK